MNGITKNNIEALRRVLPGTKPRTPKPRRPASRAFADWMHGRKWGDTKLTFKEWWAENFINYQPKPVCTPCK
jgi:hypothetical protein